jgi:hypothetical protein
MTGMIMTGMIMTGMRVPVGGMMSRTGFLD